MRMAQIIAGGTKPDSGGNVEVITQTQTTTWTQLQGKPSILVSSKGIVNGLSNIPNDGADFGPDTTLGATAPGQYGAPYTQTSGIQEAINYVADLPGTSYLGGGLPSTVIKLMPGAFIIADSINIDLPRSVNNSQPNAITYISVSGSYETSILLGNGSAGFVGNPNYQITYENFTIAPYSPTVTPISGFNTAGYNSASSTSRWVFRNIIWTNYAPGVSFSQGAVVFSNPSARSIIFDGCHLNTAGGYAYNITGGGYNHLRSVIITNEEDSSSPNIFSNFPFLFISGATAVSTYLTVENVDKVVIDGMFWEIGPASAITISGTVNQFTLQNSKLTFASTPTTSLFSASAASTINALNFHDNSISLVSNYALIDSNISINAYFRKNIYIEGGYTLTEPTNTPTISANPPVSGTAYQNTNPYDIRLKIPVTYSPTSTAAATLATGTSSTSTVTTSTKVSYPAGITTGIIDTYEMVVKAGQYFELVVTNATIGTVEVEQA